MFSLLTLLDDIATTLDDVAIMTKLAIKKTSAIMSDDLAVNAGVINGTSADRELPIIKTIFYGSLLNKLYCIVGTIILMAFYPPLIKVILFLGGLYLSFEGAHKLIEKLFHRKKEDHHAEKNITEKERINGAIRTDLILSIEIIIIAKEALTGSFFTQVISLVFVGIIASVLIYGLVAFLIKLDDLGLYLVSKNYKRLGLSLVKAMPLIMKGLGIIGTLAMFLVGGGIISHTFHLPIYLPEMIQNLILGLIAGVILTLAFEGVNRLRALKQKN